MAISTDSAKSASKRQSRRSGKLKPPDSLPQVKDKRDTLTFPTPSQIVTRSASSGSQRSNSLKRPTSIVSQNAPSVKRSASADTQRINSAKGAAITASQKALSVKPKISSKRARKITRSATNERSHLIKGFSIPVLQALPLKRTAFIALPNPQPSKRSAPNERPYIVKRSSSYAPQMPYSLRRFASVDLQGPHPEKRSASADTKRPQSDKGCAINVHQQAYSLKQAGKLSAPANVKRPQSVKGSGSKVPRRSQSLRRHASIALQGPEPESADLKRSKTAKKSSSKVTQRAQSLRRPASMALYEPQPEKRSASADTKRSKTAKRSASKVTQGAQYIKGFASTDTKRPKSVKKSGPKIPQRAQSFKQIASIIPKRARSVNQSQRVSLEKHMITRSASMDTKRPRSVKETASTVSQQVDLVKPASKRSLTRKQSASTEIQRSRSLKVFSSPQLTRSVKVTTPVAPKRIRTPKRSAPIRANRPHMVTRSASMDTKRPRSVKETASTVFQQADSLAPKRARTRKRSASTDIHSHSLTPQRAQSVKLGASIVPKRAYSASSFTKSPNLAKRSGSAVLGRAPSVERLTSVSGRTPPVKRSAVKKSKRSQRAYKIKLRSSTISQRNRSVQQPALTPAPRPIPVKRSVLIDPPRFQLLKPSTPSLAKRVRSVKFSSSIPNSPPRPTKFSALTAQQSSSGTSPSLHSVKATANRQPSWKHFPRPISQRPHELNRSTTPARLVKRSNSTMNSHPSSYKLRASTISQRTKPTKRLKVKEDINSGKRPASTVSQTKRPLKRSVSTGSVPSLTGKRPVSTNLQRPKPVKRSACALYQPSTSTIAMHHTDPAVLITPVFGRLPKRARQDNSTAPQLSISAARLAAPQQRDTVTHPTSLSIDAASMPASTAVLDALGVVRNTNAESGTAIPFKFTISKQVDNAKQPESTSAGPIDKTVLSESTAMNPAGVGTQPSSTITGTSDTAIQSESTAAKPAGTGTQPPPANMETPDTATPFDSTTAKPAGTGTQPPPANMETPDTATPFDSTTAKPAGTGTQPKPTAAVPAGGVTRQLSASVRPTTSATQPGSNVALPAHTATRPVSSTVRPSHSAARPGTSATVPADYTIPEPPLIRPADSASNIDITIRHPPRFQRCAIPLPPCIVPRPPTAPKRRKSIRKDVRFMNGDSRSPAEDTSNKSYVVCKPLRAPLHATHFLYRMICDVSDDRASFAAGIGTNRYYPRDYSWLDTISQLVTNLNNIVPIADYPMRTRVSLTRQQFVKDIIDDIYDSWGEENEGDAPPENQESAGKSPN